MSVAAILYIIGFGVFAFCASLLSAWYFGRMSDAKEQGRREVRDAITQQAIDARKREAEEYAKPRSDNWDDIVKRL